MQKRNSKHENVTLPPIRYERISPSHYPLAQIQEHTCCPPAVQDKNAEYFFDQTNHIN